MSVCSATAAASGYPRGRRGRSASTARASITEQLIERNDKVKNQKRASTGRPSISEQLMDLTDRSRQMSVQKASKDIGCCVICLLATLTFIGTCYITGIYNKDT